MKLYATTTSERASKGQGGNDRLYINVNIGDIKDMLTFTVNRSPSLKGYIVEAHFNNKKILNEIVYHPYEEKKCPHIGKKIDGFGLCGTCNQFHYKKNKGNQKKWCHHYEYLPYKEEDLYEDCAYCKHNDKLKGNKKKGEVCSIVGCEKEGCGRYYNGHPVCSQHAYEIDK